MGSISHFKGLQHYLSSHKTRLLWCHFSWFAMFTKPACEFGGIESAYSHYSATHGKCQSPELSVFNCESTSQCPLSQRPSWVGAFLHFINDLSSNVWLSLDWICSKARFGVIGFPIHKSSPPPSSWPPLLDYELTEK